MIDQTDGTNIYDYSLIDTTQSKGAIRRDIRSMRDKIYESAGTGFDDGINGAIMSSLGLGIGYQLTPRFSFGLEHKATWAMADNLDAVIDQTSNRADDVHHYTSLYLRWTLGENKGKEPIIDITAPNRSPYTVRVATGSIRATIKNISRRSGVSVTLNGQRIDYFDFNTATEEFFLTVPLAAGQNTVVIYGQNDYGSAEGSVVFIYENQNNNGANNGNQIQDPPEVEITNPRNNPFSTSNNTINIEAIIKNVSDRNNIRYTVNSFTNTGFGLSREKFTSNVILQEGRNIIEISVKNNRGEVRDTRTIIYTKPVIQAPIVTFTNPSNNPFETNNDNFNVKANIQNIEEKRNISFVVNNQPINFDFRNGRLSSQINLREGANTVKISANNEGGIDNASTMIIFKRKVIITPAPKVSITTPKGSPYNTNKENIKIYAAIQNVNFKSEITFKVNGSNKLFNYSKGTLYADVRLIQGNNTIEVSAQNVGGDDNDFVNVIYKKEVIVAPKVTVKNPIANPLVTFAKTEVITAIITGVNSQNDIQFKLNGQSNPKFSYSTASNVFKVTVNLNGGENTFEIIASNAGGTDKAGGKIVSKPQISAQPPVITILSPTKNPYTSTTGFVNLRAKIEYITGRNDVTLTIGGKTNNSFSYKNGILAIQFDIPNGGTTAVITARNGDGTDKESVQLNLNQPKQPPVITMINPSKSPYTSTKQYIDLKAKIQYVKGRNNIILKVNGNLVTGFTFNNQILSYQMDIANNGSTVEITATNADGQDKETVKINYNVPPTVKKPVIKMVNPSVSPYTSQRPSYTVQVTVQNVTNKSDITLKNNGKTVSNFTFVNGIVKYAARIPNGGTNIQIIAENLGGSDSETVRLNYNQPKQPPVITMINPSKSPYTSTKQYIDLKAKVQYVKGRNNIILKVNGNLVTGFTFNNQILSYQMDIANNGSTIEITATNADGQDKETAKVTYAKPVSKPTITLRMPTKTAVTTSKATESLSIIVGNISAKKQVRVVLNGKAISTFNFNTKNGLITASLPLKAGKNILLITATNTGGVAKKQVIFTRTIAKVTSPKQPVGAKPVIIFLTPSKTNTAVKSNVYIVKSKVTGVSKKQDIIVKSNGKVVKTFNYNPKSGMVTFKLNLSKGSNKINIVAKNGKGATTKSTAVTYSGVASSEGGKSEGGE
ncbi:MAG: hypothetical protein ACJA1N_000106 [Saprospiraceae bacterium]|jgi:hypothetical protein